MAQDATKRNTTKRNGRARKRKPEPEPVIVHPFAALDAGTLRSWDWIKTQSHSHRAMALAWCAPRCDYRNARGGPCRMPAVKGKRRCCYHGGGRSKQRPRSPPITDKEKTARLHAGAIPWPLLAAVPWLSTFKAGWALPAWRKRSLRDAFLQGDRERLMRELGEAREAARPILAKHGHDPSAIL